MEGIMDHEMLKAIADLLDEKLEQKFDEKLAPIHAKLDVTASS